MAFWDTWLKTLQNRDQASFHVVEHSAEHDTDEEEHPTEGAEECDFLDGIVFGMTYSDAKGHISRRTVTAFDLTERSGHIYLRGICHLRNGYREFRAERISEIITADGEVLAPPSFWQQIGIAQSLVDRIAEHEGKPSSHIKKPLHARPVETRVESPGLVQRRLVRHQVRVLAALSRSDGNMRPEEIAEILEFICIECDDAGIAFGSKDLEALRAYIGRLRPSSEKVEESLKKLFVPGSDEALDERQLRNLRNAMRTVIDADGLFHEGEMLFMQAFEERDRENSFSHAAPSS